jgi:hypothetical protein
MEKNYTDKEINFKILINWNISMFLSLKEQFQGCHISFFAPPVPEKLKKFSLFLVLLFKSLSHAL